MPKKWGTLQLASFFWLLAMLAGSPVTAAGFSLPEQGSKAMGMAGAFTATADDPSALFHNVGGLAFLDEREFQLGATLVSSTGAEFEGAPPFPGPGVREEMESLAEFPPHFYWTQPINRRWKFGLAINAPWGLVTEWDPNGFSGRYISTKSGLTAIDVSPNLAWRVTDRLGIGFGAIVRFSEIELNRYEGAVNPFTGQVVDIATSVLESDVDSGTGYQAGFLHRVNNSFSWGFIYKSEVEIDYQGDARFTQIATGVPQFDGLVATLLPFGSDIPISTTIEFPASWSLGVALALSRNWRVEVDYNWTGWDTFQQVVVDFGGVLPDLTIPEGWEDVHNYRIGFQWLGGARTEWRFGYVFDETPQPLETVGPLLPDADRDGFTVGFGYHGGRYSFDLAVMYLLFEDRTTLVNANGYNGSWESTGLLVGATFGW